MEYTNQPVIDFLFIRCLLKKEGRRKNRKRLKQKIQFFPSVYKKKKINPFYSLLTIDRFLHHGFSSEFSVVDTTPDVHGTPDLKEYTVTAIAPATTYYWKIVTDNGESLTSSQVRSFRTQ